MCFFDMRTSCDAVSEQPERCLLQLSGEERNVVCTVVEIAERAHCLTEESQAMCGELQGAVVQEQAARRVAHGPTLFEVTGALAGAAAVDLTARSPEVGGLALWHAELQGRGLKNFKACRRISRVAGLPDRPGRNGSFWDGHTEKGVGPLKFPRKE